jgi:type IV pilus assembly protein PilY1
MPAQAQVPLADQPVFTAVSVPGNLALALSVEFPTAVSVAHPDRTYVATNTYLGYFDPAKCYQYRYVSDTADDNYFYPIGMASAHTCSGAWSGNYMNWATMQTIDPFRWALTGGYRWVPNNQTESASLTILEKAWNTTQGTQTNFPDSSISGTTISGATPFSGATTLGTSVIGWGNKLRFRAINTGGLPAYTGTATHFKNVTTLGTLFEVFVRIKVCDASVGLESNCVAYGNNYKPEGLMQKYSNKIRYSAFGYLVSDDGGDTNLKRDGAVLRARQKFIGPTQPVPGSTAITNAKAEWDPQTGIMLKNPDSGDATSSSTTTVPIVNSGVMNYLNKFGEINRSVYKRFDPVSELYYAVLRYYRNLGNVPAWSSVAGVSDAIRTTMYDGFPVITTWDDPIIYSCQRNFVLGIGDVNTHADRNLPGATTGSKEPAMPPEVFADSVNSVDWTNKVGTLQNLGTLGTSLIPSNDAGYLMAGLAYYANTTDIRPDLTGVQTVQTYWLDVLEGGYKANRQFYLAAKYGGFNPPANFKVETATRAQFLDTAATKFWWSTTTDTIGGQPRPDNYYTAAKADQMVQGLTSAFSSIASQLKAFSTSFSTALPQVSALGVASYSARYDAQNWTGELIASQTTFDALTGDPTLDAKWSLSTTLAAQAAGTGWDKGRFIVTRHSDNKVGVPFRIASLASSQVSALDTTYVGGNDSTNYLNYLRGDRSNERSSTVSGSTNAYRDRTSLLGDIVGAKARPVGPPAAPYSSSSNPGYDVFKTQYANRTTMVYTGANDGMLHAVDGTLTGTTAGKEVWAYIPSALFAGPTSTPSVNGLASLGNPDFSHHFLVDATPLAVDIDFGKTSGGSGTDWHSVLIGGLGKGAKMIYALDITDPSSVTSETTAAAKVLWEFTDNDLGYVYGQPTVVKTKKYGWTLIMGSGYNNADGKGYLFFINPRTGALLEKVVTPCSACSASNQAGLAHVNAFVLDLTDGYADTLYAGDLLGRLWRLDISGTGSYPAPVQFAQLTGSDSKALPVTSRPLAIVQPGTNRRYVTVGTGRMLDSTDISNAQPQRFFAFLDGNNAKFSNDGTISGTTSDLPSGVTFPLTVANLKELTDINTKIALNLNTQVGWFLDLGTSVAGPGWRVLSDPTSFYGTVAFAATSPSSSDACQPGGTSRVYAIDLGSGSSVLTATGTDVDGKPKRYYDGLTGIVIDLSYYSVNVNGIGTSRLIAGSNSASNPNSAPVKAVATRNPAALGLQRLNWREINVNN